MRLLSTLALGAALIGSAFGGPRSSTISTRGDTAVSYVDPDTGFTFSEYKVAYSLTANALFRIAVPGTATSSAAYDVVLQVVAPTQVGWAALAWGGSMVKNPLSLGWANGNTPMISGRYTTSRVQPTVYSGSTYTKLTSGNKVNGTHWQLTVKCSGCTTWDGTTLNPKGSNRLAFAYSSQKPSQPSNAASPIPSHEVHAYWTQDFNLGANTNFAQLLAKNGG